MSEVWSKWQGHVVNDTFPLRRYLGSSDHSGVFLTDFAHQFLLVHAHMSPKRDCGALYERQL